MSADYVAAVDIGGTTIKCAFVDPNGATHHVGRRPTQRNDGVHRVLDQLTTTARDLATLGREQFGHPPVAFGISCLGLVDAPRGRALYSANIGWRDVPVRELIEDATELPVALVQDIQAGALAEARSGAARGVSDFLFMALGTGVGGAVFIDGKPHAGANHAAGEIGHLVTDPGGLPCACGKSGCLETVASGPAIERAFSALGGPAASAQQIVTLAIAGDAKAAHVWARTIRGLADAIDAYCMILDPQAVILGGGVSLAGDHLIAPLSRMLADQPRIARPPRLATAHHGDLAACVGAGLSAWELVSPT